MSQLIVQDPAQIVLPPEVGEQLKLKDGDIISVRVEGERVILEKQARSPLDESFGLWSDVSDGAAYVNKLREEWEDRAAELLR
jgi:bifunctional DNA-binding transcriptional regulator/antitoxin component of YhaV-PrlF toxin-antitoxin module